MMSQSHNYSLRSRGPVPSCSEAINRNLIELSAYPEESQGEPAHNDGSIGQETFNEESQNVSSHENRHQDIMKGQDASSQTDGASHRDSSQINENESPSRQYINNARNASAQLFKELEELRTKNAENIASIRMLKQELNIKEDTIQQMSSQAAKPKIERPQRSIPKLSNFSGGTNENIEVWITQFDESLHFLSDAEKLQEMLPKFRDTAADFVFGQLTYTERSDYETLLSQLELRFKTIETPRMFHIQFENRKQRVGESVHDFACELKRLYDKAFPRRPWRVRNEDLVLKFLNCILDQEAGAQVEYHKCPKTIDHAVYEMIRYMEVVGRSQPTNHSTDADLN